GRDLRGHRVHGRPRRGLLPAEPQALTRAPPAFRNEACHCEARESGPKQSRKAGRAWPKSRAGFAVTHARAAHRGLGDALFRRYEIASSPRTLFRLRPRPCMRVAGTRCRAPRNDSPGFRAAPQRQPVGHDSRGLTRRAQTKPVIARPAKRAEAISQRRQSVVEAVGGIRARAGFGAGLAMTAAVWRGASREPGLSRVASREDSRGFAAALPLRPWRPWRGGRAAGCRGAATSSPCLPWRPGPGAAPAPTAA